ncbi:myosin-16-like isoform X2 [Pomacea canaliculata]|uniref:myosin-16-like isoform X2 n=1 Tax=Pomacea canaliculata TaxID=400727 RepID=UPI000D73A9F8|nr:myosin-16-like isoform X2 [Pomacea canaliculata]
MATCSVSDDSTSVCSVCLEPYKERNPKILPCFHTFCLACLKDLEIHHLALEDRNVCGDDEVQMRSLTFPCPTCRAEITVPPGGVTQFQSNFYLTEKTLKCEVCKRDEEATHSCTDCGHNMCTQCQKYHDVFTSNHHLQQLVSSNKQHSQNIHNTDFEEKRADQLKVLEAALVTMSEEEDMLQREKQAVADVITRRADAMRALVTQAEEKSQRAISEKADNLGKQIQNKMTTARQKHAMIVTQVLSDGQPTLLSDEDFEYYQQQRRRGQQVKTLLHQFNDSAIDLQAVEAYIGTVCDDQLSVVETSLPVATDVSSGTMTDMSDYKPATSQPSDITKLTRDISDIEDKLAALDARTQILESQNQTNVSFLKDEDFKLQQNVAACQQNMDDCTRNISNIQKDIASMSQEFETMKVSNSTLQNDVDIIKKESSRNKMKTQKVKDVAKELSTEIETFKEKSSIMVAFNARLDEEKHLRYILQSDILVLSDVTCNVGQAYNKDTGIFVAPVTGIYFFMARATNTKGSETFYLDILVNKTRVARSLSTGGMGESRMSCTAHVVQRLLQGQEVSVKAGTHLPSSSASLRCFETSFTGMLVQREFGVQ